MWIEKIILPSDEHIIIYSFNNLNERMVKTMKITMEQRNVL